MRISALIVLMMLFYMVEPCKSQNYVLPRSKQLQLSGDTILLDTLSIVHGSLSITDASGQPIDSAFWTLDEAKAILILKNIVPDTSIIWNVSYRTFPFYFGAEIKHKDVSVIRTEHEAMTDPFRFTYEEKTEDIFQWGAVNKSGSISRGVSFGNSQDIVVNSTLNLQLSGRLSEDIEILAAITDNNIPIQPDGNTQQIQEFDKVYIQLFNKNVKLTAGDFEITRPSGYFMNVNKKAQGGSLTASFKARGQKDEKKPINLTLTGSAAVSKGKYARNLINGTEGNQGPYKLTGLNGENYIIILAGSEKVFIDGRPLIRGQDNDYVIDYNLGEITFTPKNIITKDKRITVEFEYSERNYGRSVYYAGAEAVHEKWDVKMHFYSEQDLKNQPLQQDLSDEEKLLLTNIGDSIHLAVVPNIDSVEFSSDFVLYSMVDTTVNSIFYDSVFIYSTNSDSAHYRLGFSYVGQSKGNYIQIQSAANGRVFKWVAPEAGVPQGTHEPIILLVTPKKKQMLTLSAAGRFGKYSSAFVETAMSVNDLNTYSSKDSRDDMGYAVRIGLDNRFPIAKKSKHEWFFIANAGHEYIQQNFKAIERFRMVEFERDWNTTNQLVSLDEHLSALKLGVENEKNNYLFYNFKSYLKGSALSAFQNALTISANAKNFFLSADGSYLMSSSGDYSTIYFKQKASLIKKFKWFSVGIREEQENDRFNQDDTLMAGSFAFDEYGAFVTSPDSAKNKISVNYKRRFDYLPVSADFRRVTTGDDAAIGLELLKWPKNIVKISATYRRLDIGDTSLTNNKPDNNIIGRIEYNLKLLKGAIISSTFYEAGSGLEVKKEFSYLEVPAGEGLYTWTDYNGNGVKELDEFEISAFTDQATFIRVFTPTSEYIRAYSAHFSEALNIDPANVWRNKKGLKKFISRFSAQASYSILRKSTDTDLLHSYNPFFQGIADSSILTITSGLRTTLFFNKSSTRYALEAGIQDNRNRMLLINGFDARDQQSLHGRVRLNIARWLGLNASYINGYKESLSEYFSTRDYRIYFQEAEPKITVQPSSVYRISFLYKYATKHNSLDSLGEMAIIHDGGMEFKYNFLSKGSLQIKLNYIHIAYNAATNTSLSYEMLEGLKPGDNAIWSLMFQRNLSDYLQLNLLYDGRYSAGNKVIHVGSVQLRAHF